MNGFYKVEHTNGTKEFGTSIDQNRKGNWQINICQPIKKELYFEFSCNNEVFMNEFAKMLSRFYQEFSGKIEVKEGF